MVRSVLRDGNTCATVARIQFSPRTCRVEIWDKICGQTCHHWSAVVDGLPKPGPTRLEDLLASSGFLHCGRLARPGLQFPWPPWVLNPAENTLGLQYRPRRGARDGTLGRTSISRHGRPRILALIPSRNPVLCNSASG